MEHFLELAARDLFNGFSSPESGLSDITVVFPNRRARLFFDEFLSHCSSVPVWSPAYMTIEELFRSQSQLHTADRFKLVSMLHKVYVSVTHTDESLDSFWSWGELMLSDFEDLDRNMADSTMLFKLLKEQKDMDMDHSYLTEEQSNTLKEFFNLKSADSTSELRRKYRDIWAALGDIYDRFRTTLKEQGLAYDGMLQREVAMNLDVSRFTARKYAFIGFNSLDAAEKCLFTAMLKAGKALFYWDYDISYTDNSSREAGLFLRKNMQLFPNRLGKEHYDNMGGKKTLTIVETQSDSAQAGYIGQWLAGLGERPDRDTAVVLSDSSLIQSVLHSIPQGSADALNITMGYPLTGTMVHTLTAALLDMQRTAMKNGGKVTLKHAMRVLDNPLTSRMAGKEAADLKEFLTGKRIFFPTLDQLASGQVMSVLFRRCKDNLSLLDWLLDCFKAMVPAIKDDPDNTVFRPLNQESVYRMYTSVNRFRSLTLEGSLDTGTDTLCHLISRVMASVSVPFHGEPVVGMQVMGLIETRNLDFRNVLLLSASEGILPGNASESSFIPFSIRNFFGLTTMTQKSAVAAYNFHHLLQRAENVTMVYNANADATGLGRGQMSRYLLQLITSGREIRRVSLTAPSESVTPYQPQVKKTDEVLKKLRSKYDIHVKDPQFLSPTAVNDWLDCGMKFYFKHLAQIKPREELPSDIDVALFGTIFHKSAELVYEDMASKSAGRTISADMIKALLADRRKLEDFVKKAFTECVFKKREASREEYSGSQDINFEVICRYLVQILKMDLDYTPFSYLEGESKGFSDYMEVPDPLDPSCPYTVKLHGFIDRMDVKDGITRIADYKTGREKPVPANIESLFEKGKKDRNSHIFQIFYYADLVSRNGSFSGRKLAPVIIHVRTSAKADPEKTFLKMGGENVTDFISTHLPEYRKLLQKTVEDIFNPDIPFECAEDSGVCEYCDFKQLCGR